MLCCQRVARTAFEAPYLDTIFPSGTLLIIKFFALKMSFSVPIRLKFGDFEANLQTAELFRNGSAVPLQEKPFRILALLLMRPGELVTRTQIFEEVWPDTYVQEDQSLNTAIRKIRLALGDSAETPEFIQTVGSRGYRFVQPVQLAQNGNGPGSRSLRLGVLLFSSDSNHDEQFSDGITHELIGRLGRLHSQLSVVVPTVSPRDETQLAEIAEQLDLDYLLTGSLWHDASNIRVTIKLIAGEDQSCLSSITFQRELADFAVMQREIAERVARSALRLLSPTGSAHGTNLSALEAYLRGRFFWNKRTGPALMRSLDLFGEALRHDPDYTMAYVGLADAYIVLAQHGLMAPLDAIPKAKEAAAKALELDDKLAEAYTSLAWARAVYDRDMHGAELKCRKAVQLDPGYAFAYVSYAFILTAQGRHSEALASLKRALHLDPVSLPINAIYASALFYSRQYDAAIEQCRACIELDSNFTLAYAIYGQALEQKGELGEATEYFTIQKRMSPWNALPWAHLARVYARRGLMTESRDNLQHLLELTRDKLVPCYFIALIHAASGNTEEVMKWLADAEQQRSSWVLFMGVDPRLDAFRGDPRFQELLHKLKLGSVVQRTSV